jgi:hypothetical protein
MIGRPSFGAPKVRSPSPPLSRIFPCVSYCSGDISAVAVTALYSSRSGVCIVTGPSLPSFFCVSLSCPSLPPPLPPGHPRGLRLGAPCPCFTLESLSPLRGWGVSRLPSSPHRGVALRWLPIRSPSGGGFAPQVCTWLTGCADLLLFLAFPPTQFLLLPKIPFSLVLSTPLPLCDPSSPLPLFSWLASA